MKAVGIVAGTLLISLANPIMASAQSSNEGERKYVNGSNPYFASSEEVAKTEEASKYLNKGYNLLKQGKPDDAIEEFKHAQIILPGMGIEMGMAEAYTQKRKYKDAIEWYRKIIYPPPGHSRSESDPRQLMRYAIVLNRAEKPEAQEEAITIYNRALMFLPKWVSTDVPPLDIVITSSQYDGKLLEAAARVALASTQLISFDKDALTEIDQALQLQPNLAIAHFYRGDILSRNPQKQAEAVQEFAIAVRGKENLRPFAEKSLKFCPQETKELAAKLIKPKKPKL